MLKIYGTLRCPDCVDCCADLDRENIQYEFLDFDKDLRALKEFLIIRDELPLFDTVRQEGSIGIPCLVRDDHTVTLDWKDIM